MMGLLHRPVVVWLVLIAITVVSVTLAESGFAGKFMPGKFMIVAIFVAAIVKGQLVAVHFMETPRALSAWNSLYRIWIVAIGLVLCVAVALAP